MNAPLNPPSAFLRVYYKLVMKTHDVSCCLIWHQPWTPLQVAIVFFQGIFKKNLSKTHQKSLLQTALSFFWVDLTGLQSSTATICFCTTSRRTKKKGSRGFIVGPKASHCVVEILTGMKKIGIGTGIEIEIERERYWILIPLFGVSVPFIYFSRGLPYSWKMDAIDFAAGASKLKISLSRRFAEASGETTIKGPDNPTCQPLPKRHKRNVKGKVGETRDGGRIGECVCVCACVCVMHASM